MIKYPNISSANILSEGKRRLFIGAYGFEERSNGWVKIQKNNRILDEAMVIRYVEPKGKNKIKLLQDSLTKLGVKKIRDVRYSVFSSRSFEDILYEVLIPKIEDFDEIIVDISAMSKFIILICMLTLRKYNKTVRIIYSEANTYSPTKEEYELSKSERELKARFPNQGFESIFRARCLSSIRMQGQPITLIAFTSFNERLIQAMLGSISPHRLILINASPGRKKYAWRSLAVQEIHNRLISEYIADNPLDDDGNLIRAASFIDYRSTIELIDQLYEEFGNYEKIICAATGSKMQTVGLFFSKIRHPDLHLEYPTPDSYYPNAAKNVGSVHEVKLLRFARFLENLH